MLSNKKILIAVTGSIAAYKIATVVRLLIKEGAEVKVIMTDAATHFITPLTLSTLSRNKVFYELYTDESWTNHVMLGRWADIMIVAPLSCNSLAKIAAGICDNLVSAVYLSATCPVAVAPAMDEDMWLHPSTRANLLKLQSYGNYILQVNHGELASGLVGPGRMAEPEEMLTWLHNFFDQKDTMDGKKVLITAGPTHEALDPVRYISNASSGKMGIALAREIQKRGGQVTLIIGPVSEIIPAGFDVIQVTSAEEMYTAAIAHFETVDWAIMSAAVADYTPIATEENKIKKSGEEITLKLKKTKDILAKLGELKKTNQVLVGFALETENETDNALEKLKRKNADFIILNSMRDAGAGFGKETNKISIFSKDGDRHNFDTKSKTAVAADIINTIINHKR